MVSRRVISSRLLDELPEDDLPKLMETLRRRSAGAARTENSFFASSSLADLAARQGVSPIADTAALQGDFWPEDESVDDLIAAIRVWRHEGE